MDRLSLFVFIIYCTCAGVILTMLPWSPAWTRMLALLPYPGLDVLESPWLRGLLSGFGLVHLVWSAHDLHLLLSEALLPEDDGG